MTLPRSPARPWGMTAGRIGNQEPTFSVMAPDVASTAAAEEAIQCYHLTGRRLDVWQQNGLRMGLAERANGTPAAFEYATVLSRQNGKGDEIEAAEIYWLFMVGEPLITHSAHEFPTARKAWMRMVATIQSVPDFDRQVARIPKSHGSEGVVLKNGCALEYRPRTGGAGRGSTGAKLVMDEAMILDVGPVAALVPTLATMRNAQVFYYGSAGSKSLPTGSTQLAAVRRRAYSNDPRVRGRLAYREWAIGRNDDATDPESWYRTNPALGARITEEYVENEMRVFAADPDGFARERCGRGDWPAADGWEVVAEEVWNALADPYSELVGKVALAFDCTPEQTWTTVSVAGVSALGWLHTEVIAHRPGIDWVADYVRERWTKHRPCIVVADPNSPTRPLISEVKARHVRVYEPPIGEVAEWCQAWYDAVAIRGSLRWLGVEKQAVLSSAVQQAVRTAVHDGGWRWARRKTDAVLSPLVSSNLALGGWLRYSRNRRAPLVATA